MAVVKTIIASNGAICRIHDDAYVNEPPEVIRKRQQDLIRVATDLYYEALLTRQKWAEEAAQAEAAKKTKETPAE